MQIDIQHIAKLSRLSIEKEKVEKFQKEMENIVAMCEKLPRWAAAIPQWIRRTPCGSGRTKSVLL